MSSASADFAILTSRLVLLPTPIAINIHKYRALYSFLHSSHEFCDMGFGPHFPARETDDKEITSWIEREVKRSWEVRGLGDFAVGVWNCEVPEPVEGEKLLQNGSGGVKIRVVPRPHLFGVYGDRVNWVGYVGVRDASILLPLREPDDKSLPDWKELVEVRYGVNMSDWGKGYGTEAARGLLLWAEKEMGIRRFVAETEKLNQGSGKILRKLGFVEREGNEYWKEGSQIEWDKVVMPKA